MQVENIMTGYRRLWVEPYLLTLGELYELQYPPF